MPLYQLRHQTFSFKLQQVLAQHNLLKLSLKKHLRKKSIKNLNNKQSQKIPSKTKANQPKNLNRNQSLDPKISQNQELT
jgi:hypothetical protein